ncbi:uncharacterized protein LOC127475961 [Manacus candei]|uniref:uncharacterized protein LOC127475961 n=1 Tax=Manacus candei TaxID=415023 RepID=UPI002228061B|nr:uncharacterized protein LOC127475961 [Manacus candei]
MVCLAGIPLNPFFLSDFSLLGSVRSWGRESQVLIFGRKSSAWWCLSFNLCQGQKRVKGGWEPPRVHQNVLVCCCWQSWTKGKMPPDPAAGPGGIPGVQEAPQGTRYLDQGPSHKPLLPWPGGFWELSRAQSSLDVPARGHLPQAGKIETSCSSWEDEMGSSTVGLPWEMVGRALGPCRPLEWGGAATGRFGGLDVGVGSHQGPRALPAPKSVLRVGPNPPSSGAAQSHLSGSVSPTPSAQLSSGHLKPPPSPCRGCQSPVFIESHNILSWKGPTGNIQSNSGPAQDTPTIPLCPSERCPNPPGALAALGLCPLPWGAWAVPNQPLGEEPFPKIHPDPALIQLQPFPGCCPWGWCRAWPRPSKEQSLLQTLPRNILRHLWRRPSWDGASMGARHGPTPPLSP